MPMGCRRSLCFTPVSDDTKWWWFISVSIYGPAMASNVHGEVNEWMWVWFRSQPGFEWLSSRDRSRVKLIVCQSRPSAATCSNDRNRNKKRRFLLRFIFLQKTGWMNHTKTLVTCPISSFCDYVFSFWLWNERSSETQQKLDDRHNSLMNSQSHYKTATAD